LEGEKKERRRREGTHLFGEMTAKLLLFFVDYDSQIQQGKGEALTLGGGEVLHQNRYREVFWEESETFLQEVGNEGNI